MRHAGGWGSALCRLAHSSCPCLCTPQKKKSKAKEPLPDEGNIFVSAGRGARGPGAALLSAWALTLLFLIARRRVRHQQRAGRQHQQRLQRRERSWTWT